MQSLPWVVLTSMLLVGISILARARKNYKIKICSNANKFSSHKLSGAELSLWVPVQVLIKYWRCYVRMPAVVASDSTCELQVGLTEVFYNLCQNTRGDVAKAEQLKEAVENGEIRKIDLHGAKYEEYVMNAGGGLYPDTIVAVHLIAPSFAVDPRRRHTAISELVRNPVTFLLSAKTPGEHLVRIEFVHPSGEVRGSLRVPIKVDERDTVSLKKATMLLGMIGMLVCCIALLALAWLWLARMAV
jgi:hypothetical protein